MRQRYTLIAVILLLAIHSAAAIEWYEQGHQNLLTWQNFDSSIAEKGTYKFVKFFTRNCRYCRLLKQVEEQLQKEKDWGFKFYSVDCSIHYDLCSAKASISAFPYVGIYNTSGVMTGKIGGFYPLQTMREAFKTIEEWQHAEVKVAPTEQSPQPTETKVETPAKTPETKEITVQNTVKTPEVEVKVKTEEKPKQNAVDEDDDWSTSIKDGIRMTIMLLGVIIFNKTISPYLQKEKLAEDYSKPRIIQLPLHSSQPDPVKSDGNDESNKLLNDTL